LRSQAARWAGDNFDKLADPDPKMPNLNDRAADNWRPLLAIADRAGGTWPKEARWAACLVSGEEQDGAIGVELLRDIRSTANSTSWPSSAETCTTAHVGRSAPSEPGAAD
jgi:hypothetical protein